LTELVEYPKLTPYEYIALKERGKEARKGLKRIKTAKATAATVALEG